MDLNALITMDDDTFEVLVLSNHKQHMLIRFAIRNKYNLIWEFGQEPKPWQTFIHYLNEQDIRELRKQYQETGKYTL